VATLTLRDLDDSLKLSLRMRAASNNRSMEEEARQILRAALTVRVEPALNLFDSIRSQMVGLGDVNLVIAPREVVRPPPTFKDFKIPTQLGKITNKTTKLRKPRTVAAASSRQRSA
jgi:antitoxin FitA